MNDKPDSPAVGCDPRIFGAQGNRTHRILSCAHNLEHAERGVEELENELKAQKAKAAAAKENMAAAIKELRAFIGGDVGGILVAIGLNPTVPFVDECMSYANDPDHARHYKRQEKDND